MSRGGFKRGLRLKADPMILDVAGKNISQSESSPLKLQ